MDLQSSKWAPALESEFAPRSRPLCQRPQHKRSVFASAAPLKTLREGSPDVGPESIEQYDKIIKRLEHKSRLLFLSHQGATNASTASILDSDANTHFKLDFFEFYSLLEAALVHLLSIFRIKVNAIVPLDNNLHRSKVPGGPGGSPKEKPSSRETTPTPTSHPFKHQFHMNVLAAFDEPGPLHDVLGTGNVRMCLATAKDMRNSWKTAYDEAKDKRAKIRQLEGAWDENVPDIPSLQAMERMMNTIYIGLLQARPLAEEETKTGNFHASWRETKRENSRQLSATYRQDDDTMDCDDPVEVIIDAMEIG